MPAKAVGAARPVGGKEGAVGAMPAQRQRHKIDLDGDLGACYGQPVLALAQLEPRWRGGVEIEAVAPLPRSLAGLAAHHPAARHAETPRRLEDDPGQSRRRQQDPTGSPLAAIELDAVIEATLEPRPFDTRHAAGWVAIGGAGR